MLLLAYVMSPPTDLNLNSPNFGPYRLTLDVGASWLSPAPSAPSMPGFTLGTRLGESYRLSENWNWAFQGVFSYSQYYARQGSVSRIGIGFETGPELNLVPQMLSLGLYTGLQEAFYYSKQVSWPSRLGEASFDNEPVTSLSLRPSVLLFGGILAASFEYSHDFGLTAPGPTSYDARVGFSPNRYTLLLSADIMRAFYAGRGGFTGASDNFEEFFMGIRPSLLVEGTYNYSFNNPAGRAGAPGANPYHTNNPLHHRPRLNLVEVALDRPSTERSPLGFRLDANFGQDPVSFAPRSSLIEPVIGSQGGPDTQYFALQQAYMTYRFPVLEGLTFQAGQFATTVGNEILEGPLNTFLLLTRGLNNILAEPFYHAGGLFRLKISENKNEENELQNSTEAVVGVVNGWDSVLGHEGGPTLMTGFNHTVNPHFSYSLNYLIGPQEGGAQGLFNFNTLLQPEDEWKLGVNLDLGHGTNPADHSNTIWFGLGLYQQYAPASWFNLAAREEVFTDPNGARTGISQTLLSGTLAANFLIPYGFGVGPELRHDHSVGRDQNVPGPFQSGRNDAEGNTIFTLRAFWRYPFN